MPADLFHLLSRAATGLGVSVALAGAAYLGRTLTVSGLLAAVAVGTAVWAGFGWRGFLVLAAFFVLASALTRTGYRRKAAAGLAEGRGGRRTASQVLANGGVAAVMAGLAVFAPESVAAVLAPAFAGAFATAAADTAGTEVGQLLRRRTYLVTTLRPVPPGTDGGLSLPGTAATLAAALLVGGLGGVLGLYGPAGGWFGALAVAAAGFAGATADSVLGATLERRELLDNDRVNLLATLAGALVAAALAWIVL